jgi:hypothetical protein
VAPVLPLLPFCAAAFHLIINRHESFVAAEVARVLAPGGAFLTQQVASDLGASFRALLGAPSGPPPAPPWTLAEVVRQVRSGGLEITNCAEGAATLTFADVGALVWYLIHVPWVMPEFSISLRRPQLEALHQGRIITVQQRMLWLAARKAESDVSGRMPPLEAGAVDPRR